MSESISGCLLCGKPLIYNNGYMEATCRACKKVFVTSVICEDGHFFCDECHSGSASRLAKLICTESESKNPFEILELIFALPQVHMHGPEHHTILASALLAAFCNAGFECDRKKALAVIAERSKNVPGGICGFWGTCGAAVSAGIFMSVITKSTPLSTEAWSKCNLLTSKALKSISEHGGPRCCKRNSFLAAQEAVKFAKEEFGIEMDVTGLTSEEASPDDTGASKTHPREAGSMNTKSPDSHSKIICRHYINNKECLKDKCPFYGVS